jgi:uncharacterized protein YkwD
MGKRSCVLRAGRTRTVRGLRATLAAVVLLCALASSVATAAPRARAAASPCPGAALSPTVADGAAIDSATLCLVNEIRAAHHLHALRANGQLAKVATSQVATMIRWDYFADVRPTGQTPLSLVGVTRYPAHAAAFAVGQNIAWGTASFATPEHIVAEWMASPPHRAIILTSAYRDAGVAVTPALPGVLRAGQGGATYAMEFGVRHF